MRASHILIEYQGWWPPERRRCERDKEEAYLTAIELHKRVSSGESFSDLARVHSACDSAAKGGDLGHFLTGDMLPRFEAAVLSVEPGEIARITKTEHGYHVIRRTD